MKYIFASFLLTLVVSGFSQTINGYNMTIKKTGSNQIGVFATPQTASGSGAYSPVFSQINYVIGVPVSCASSGPPSVNTSLSSSITNQGIWSLTLNKPGDNLSFGGVNYYIYEYSWNNSSPGVNTLWSVGTETLVATVSFTGKPESCLIYLIDDGINSSTNSYIVDAGSNTLDGCLDGNTYFTPQCTNMNFYASAGNSTTSSSGGTIFAGTINNVSLPLTLLSFSAAERDCKVRLDWKTADEVNTSHFEIETGDDGRNFRTIGRVEAQGNGTGRSYAFATVQAGGTSFYRLKMVDLDGSFTYSPVQSLRTRCAPATTLSMYPNPLVQASDVTLKLTTTYKGTAGIQLTGIDGRQLQLQKVTVFPGVNNYTVNTTGLLPGTYLIRFINGNGEAMAPPQKLVKQ